MTTASAPPAPKAAPLGHGIRSSAPVRRWSAAEKLWVGMLVVTVAIAGAWHLGQASLWNDEAATWAISGHKFGDVVHVLGTSNGDRGAALYYVTAYFWIHVFGSTETALRLLSLLAAAATMIPFHACARRLVPPSAGYVAGVILATSGFFLTQARDARTYSLAVLVVVLAVWTFLCALDSMSTRAWWTFTVVAAAAVYVHWFSSLVIVGLFAGVCATRCGRDLRQRLLISSTTLVVATLPIAVVLLAGRDSSVDWIAPLNGAQLRSLATNFSGTSSQVVQLLLAVPLVVGLVGSWVDRPRSGAPPIAVSWLVVPIVATVGISFVKPLLVPRYLIVVLPAYALAIGVGLTLLGRRQTVRVVLLTVAFIVVSSASFVSSGPGKEDWRAIVATVGARARPDDAIVVYPSTAASAFAYYARHDPTLRRRFGLTWPPRSWEAPFTRSVANTGVEHQRALASAGVVWLVVRQPGGATVNQVVRRPPQLEALRRQLTSRFTVVTVLRPWRSSDIVSVVRYTNPTSQ